MRLCLASYLVPKQKLVTMRNPHLIDQSGAGVHADIAILAQHLYAHLLSFSTDHRVPIFKDNQKVTCGQRNRILLHMCEVVQIKLASAVKHFDNPVVTRRGSP
jgi:hypothetical protein